tara:strand:+ start:42 stop:713 length:672 start_codon:yes stop_codon:yes gene_type:complete
MADKVTAANKKIAKAASKMATGPAGASILDIPTFAKGMTPQMLFDLAKDKGVITKEQQADFTRRVGKDRRALAEFNEIVSKSEHPRLRYVGQSPEQVAMMRAKGLWPQTAANKAERVNIIKQSKKFLDEAASMDAPRETKIQTFLQSMKTAFGEFADTPIVRKIANKALMILKVIPTGPLDALDFIPQDIFEQDFLNMDREPEMVAKGGIMNINEVTRPISYV